MQTRVFHAYGKEAHILNPIYPAHLLKAPTLCNQVPLGYNDGWYYERAGSIIPPKPLCPECAKAAGIVQEQA
jgi:hypothetical protein